MIQEFLLRLEQGLEESVQVLINHFGRGFDAFIVILLLLKDVLFALSFLLALILIDFLVQQIQLLLLLDFNQLELGARFKLLFAFGLVKIRHPRVLILRC